MIKKKRQFLVGGKLISMSVPSEAPEDQTRLRRWLEENSLSMRQASKVFHIAASTLSNAAKATGKRKPAYVTLAVISHVTGIPVEELEKDYE